MEQTCDDILKIALNLSAEERAALAASLIESLDPVIDDDVDSAWQAEVQKRLSEIQSGTAVLVPWSELRQKLDLNDEPF